MANGSTASKKRMQKMVNKVNGGGKTTDFGNFTHTDYGRVGYSANKSGSSTTRAVDRKTDKKDTATGDVGLNYRSRTVVDPELASAYEQHQLIKKKVKHGGADYGGTTKIKTKNISKKRAEKIQARHRRKALNE
jgi:hypothetical protein